MTDGVHPTAAGPRRGSHSRTARAARGIERRFPVSATVRHQINKVFPWHFSFLWGEIALYSFVVLVLSGTYLTLYYVPSLDEITYQGSYRPIYGLDVSRAYASVLDLSFDVRAGLFVRQMHHWAAHIFLAAIMLHMCRIFFTGAYRAPRESNWFLGVIMLVVSIFEGYLGYSMLDDLLSGTGVRIFSGILLSIPVIGTWLHWMVFSSEFPGEIFIERFYIAHVLLLPGILVALIGMHLAVVWYQKHTQFPGPRAREDTVVGNRTVPIFAIHSGTMLLATAGVIGALGGLAQINPVWHWGEYNPVHDSNGSEPDWYASFLIGALRLFPRADLSVAGRYTVPAGFWAGVVIPTVMIVLLLSYPLLERLWNRERTLHNLLDRPRDNPERAGIGAMALTFWGILFVLGGDDVLSVTFHVSYEQLVWIGRVGVFVLPPLAYWLVRRWMRGLQRSDREVLARGVATGLIVHGDDGTYTPVRQPLIGVDDAGDEHEAAYTGARIPKTPDDPVAPPDGPAGSTAGPATSVGPVSDRSN